MREVPIRTVGLLPCHRLDAADHPAFKTLVRGQGDIRQTRSLFRDLLEQQRPFLLTGLPLRPAETILAGLPGGRVEVAASSSGSFSGAYNAHNALQMSVQDFFSYEGRLRLYLAQVPLVFRAEERAAAAAAGSASPSRSCSLARNWARFLRCEVAELTQVGPWVARCNLWVNRAETLSEFHFDSYAGLLAVFSGCKRVLLGPNCLLPAASLFCETPNIPERFCSFAPFSPSQIRRLQRRHHWTRARLARRTPARPCFYFAEIRAGEALHIPEGWWHTVSTPAPSVALNFWLDFSQPPLTRTRLRVRREPSYTRRQLLIRLVAEILDHLCRQPWTELRCYSHFGLQQRPGVGLVQHVLTHAQGLKPRLKSMRGVVLEKFTYEFERLEGGASEHWKQQLWGLFESPGEQRDLLERWNARKQRFKARVLRRFGEAWRGEEGRGRGRVD